nr:hypothetical protein [Anatilimnocola aggregata]
MNLDAATPVSWPPLVVSDRNDANLSSNGEKDNAVWESNQFAALTLCECSGESLWFVGYFPNRGINLRRKPECSFKTLLPVPQERFVEFCLCG